MLSFFSRYNILIPCSSYITTIINLGFFCCRVHLLSSFCKATSIVCYDGYCTAVLLSSKALENASIWAILLPFLYSIVKSYYCSLHNYQILLLNGKFTVHIV